MTIRQIARACGVTAILAATILSAFGWRKKGPDPLDQPLDVQLMVQQIQNGLEDLSDADRRSLGMGRDSLRNLSLGDAELARRIADILSRGRKE